MKKLLLGLDTGTLVFTPGGAGSGTIVISAMANFSVSRVLAITNVTRGVLLYVAQSAALNGSWSSVTGAGGTLTLEADTTGYSSGDALQVIYGDADSSNVSIGVVKTPFAVSAGVDLTRPANTTAYAANDAVSNSTPSAITLTLGDVNDDTFTVERLRLYTNDTGPGTATAMFEAWLYNKSVTPSSDNAAFNVTGDGLIGVMAGTFRATNGGSHCILTPYEGGRIITTPVSGAKTINVVLKTLTAFTPSANSTVFNHIAEGFRGRA